MFSFVLLCLASRFFYSLNDVFTGRLARKYDRIEVAALRGVSLGLTMAPLLLFVPARAWASLRAELPLLLAIVTLTAVANILALQSARYLPFGVRASLITTATSLVSLGLGVMVLGERLTLLAFLLCALIVGSAVVAALGEHASHEIEPKLARGALLASASGFAMALVALWMKRLATSTHPLLAAWAWEFGAGGILVVPALLRGVRWSGWRRFGGVTLASSPTVLGSGASILALQAGQLGLWGALAGTQVLFTAALGVLWHREAMGARRWACFALASAGLAGLALFRR
ncbi:MAG: DMT family transporter [Polyangiaceae bacterium]